jgi:hypothetical protein
MTDSLHIDGGVPFRRKKAPRLEEHESARTQIFRLSSLFRYCIYRRPPLR